MLRFYYTLLFAEGCRSTEKRFKMFPGNKIPFLRGNVVAKRQFEDLVQSYKDLSEPDIGYNEGKNFTMVKIKSVVYKNGQAFSKKSEVKSNII